MDDNQFWVRVWICVAVMICTLFICGFGHQSYKVSVRQKAVESCVEKSDNPRTCFIIIKEQRN